MRDPGIYTPEKQTRSKADPFVPLGEAKAVHNRQYRRFDWL